MRVVGGVTANDLAMQVQANILGVPLRRPMVAETTGLGAAYAAGLTVGFSSGIDDAGSRSGGRTGVKVRTSGAAGRRATLEWTYVS
jgi:glycerol kinase